MNSYGLRGEIHSKGIHILTKEDQPGHSRGKVPGTVPEGRNLVGYEPRVGQECPHKTHKMPLQEAMAAFNCNHPVTRWDHRVNAGFLLSQGRDMVAPMIPTPLFPGIRGSILALLEK